MTINENRTMFLLTFNNYQTPSTELDIKSVLNTVNEYPATSLLGKTSKRSECICSSNIMDAKAPGRSVLNSQDLKTTHVCQ